MNPEGKIVVSAVSLILVVGVVVGVVTEVTKSGSGTSISESLDPQLKAVKNMCYPTVHKDLCVQTLSQTTANETSDPKELIRAAILASLNSMKDSINFTSTLNSTKPRVKMAIDDCKEMMDYAVDKLRAALSFVEESDINTVNERVSELRSWLSSVVAYQTSCVDGLEGLDYKADMEKNVLDTKKLTGNVLMILSEISTLLSVFDLELNYYNSRSSRRLLSSNNYPTWLSAAASGKLLADEKGVAPNAVVAKDGSGQFNSINDALKAYPEGQQGRYVVYVKEGVYEEYVTVEKDMVHVFMYGDGPTKTIITGNRSNKGGWSTWRSATFSVIGDGFVGKLMGIRNTAGFEARQAVALRVQSQNSAFYNCGIDGYQDTLYVQSGRQLFYDCSISGTVDFIFGASQCIIQNSQIIPRKGGSMNTITAPGGSEPGQVTGIVIQNCNIIASRELEPVKHQIKTYLGRPWKEYATSVFMETATGDFIQPEGYLSWNGDDKGYFAEYNNRGASADTSKRVQWKGFKGNISKEEALKWTAASFLDGHLWLNKTGVPYLAGLTS